jgi:hypothetical protein
MTFARANRDTDSRLPTFGRVAVGQGPKKLAGSFCGSEITPSGLVQQQRLLRALVERFGGEVTASVLYRYLSHESGWLWTASGPKLTEMLWDLQSAGAVELEPKDDQDLIVRLQVGGGRIYT